MIRDFPLKDIKVMLFIKNDNYKLIMRNQIRFIINILIFFFIVIVLFSAITVISSVSYTVASQLYGNFGSLDPYNSFLLITLHHILQAIAAGLIICLMAKVLNLKLQQFGFNLNGFSFSMKKIMIFCGVFTVVQLVGSIYLINTASIPVGFSFPLTFRNFLGYFLFEILLTGTSEEILFRALSIPLVLHSLKFIKSERKANVFAVMASTFIFMLAHINFNLNPFQITYFYPLQQITCFITGTFFGYLFVKTKSVLGPMIAHNAINGIITMIGFFMFLIFG